MSALSAALLIFSFQFSLLFFHTSVVMPHPHCGVLLVLIRNNGHWTLPWTWVGIKLSCAERTGQGKDFELILPVKMKTRHPAENQFGSEFRAICNHCGVMMAWSCKTWKYCEQFFVFFWGNDPLRLDLQNSVRKVFTASPIDFVVLKFREIYQTENRRNRALFISQTKKNSAASQTVVTALIASKRVRASPQQCAHSAPDFIQISSVSAGYSRTREHRFLPRRVFP